LVWTEVLNIIRVDLWLTNVECNAEIKPAVTEATGNLRHCARSLTLDDYPASRHLLGFVWLQQTCGAPLITRECRGKQRDVTSTSPVWLVHISGKYFPRGF
jgi:hypothetical protein